MPVSQQYNTNTIVPQELEDMILRIEKHFKAEQAARKKAEELLQVRGLWPLPAGLHVCPAVNLLRWN